MKQLILIILAALMAIYSTTAQGQSYYFTSSVDTAIESNARIVASYIKTDIAPSTPDTVLVVIKSGAGRPTHMDTTSQYTFIFAAGQDSLPFYIQLHDDTFPENPEHITYVIRNNNSSNTIAADSLLAFVLIDNDLPATISFVIDTGSAWIDDGSYTVCETINNPNPFYVRFFTRTYDYAFTTPLAVLTAVGGFNYAYTWDTLYAAPGVSTLCQNITIVGSTDTLPNKTLMVVLQNIDANTLIDSTFLFTIKNDNYYYPPSVSFDQNSLIVYRDTSSFIVGIPLTTINPNHRAFTFTIDTLQFNSTSPFEDAASFHFNYPNGTISHPGGTWHDTLLVNILDDHLIFDTSYAVIKISGVVLNTSPDTLFHLTIIDTGSLFVSFKGAGFAHLKDDSIGYVQVYTSSPSPYPVSVDVSYLNGDAVEGVDFLWRDTTIIFPALMFDTISLPVVMLKDHLHDGNKQVNLQLTNASPASGVAYDIRQYTFTIIDDDSTASYPASILPISSTSEIAVYPNPFSTELNIHMVSDNYRVSVITMLGEKIYDMQNQSNDSKIDMKDMPAGIYMLHISNPTHSEVRMITKK